MLADLPGLSIMPAPRTPDAVYTKKIWVHKGNFFAITPDFDNAGDPACFRLTPINAGTCQIVDVQPTAQMFQKADFATFVKNTLSEFQKY